MRGVPLCEDVAIKRNPSAQHGPEIFSVPPAGFAITIGSRKIDPADARITFELNGLTVPSPSTTPALPEGLRTNAGSFPDSRDPVIRNTTINGPDLQAFQHILREKTPSPVLEPPLPGATRWGHARRRVVRKQQVSTFAPICGSRRSARFCADSRKNTARKRSPLRIASSTIRMPSMAQNRHRPCVPPARTPAATLSPAAYGGLRCGADVLPALVGSVPICPHGVSLSIGASYSASRCGLASIMISFAV